VQFVQTLQYFLPVQRVEQESAVCGFSLFEFVQLLKKRTVANKKRDLSFMFFNVSFFAA